MAVGVWIVAGWSCFLFVCFLRFFLPVVRFEVVVVLFRLCFLLVVRLLVKGAGYWVSLSAVSCRS